MTSDKELKALTKVARGTLPYPVIGDHFITDDNAEDWAEEIIAEVQCYRSNLPDDFVEIVKRHAVANLVDSNQDPLEMALEVLKAYSDQAIIYFEKIGEIAKVLNKIEKVIPLLLRAMETSDDLDLLEASVDLLEVHLARLSELTK
jgi:hypothetical protein